jgi:serine/threonine protein kinase
MVASPVSPHLIGGRYRLESSIGTGGMAEVWRATDMQLGRMVAVKMLKPNVASDQVIAERFRREARSLARLSHPHIVPVYDCVEENNQVALVMELILGKSLRDLLDDAAEPGKRAGTISVHLTVRIGTAIALALAKSHETNIIHRDIKPGNILVTGDGRVLLTDFGIAKPLRSSDDDPTDLTSANIMMGTAKYLSPEQVQGKELDGRADIYSLGLVLYECLAGEVPFRGENDQATAIARLQRDHTPLQNLRPDVPSTVVAVIDRMLRRKPEHRYGDCNEVARALTDALRHTHDAVTPVSGVDIGTPPRRPVSRPEALGDPLIGKRTKPILDGIVDEGAATSQTPPKQPRPAPRDKTPQGLVQVPAALPGKHKTRTSRSYVAVGLLLTAALVMSAMLWRGIQNTGGDVPAATADVALAPVELVGLRSYDPGGDGEENESMLGALTDSNPATTWTTVCYGNRYFGSKGGVGIVAQLSGVGIGTLSATFANGPWSADVFVASGEAPPTTLDAWGLRVADNFGRDPGTANFEVRTPGRWVLLWLREAGRNGTCSNNNPFKSELSSVSFTSAP